MTPITPTNGRTAAAMTAAAARESGSIEIRFRSDPNLTEKEADRRFSEALLRLHDRRRELIAAGVLKDATVGGAEAVAPQGQQEQTPAAPLDRTLVSPASI